MTKEHTMAGRQRGALGLLRVAVFSAVLAAAAMAGIWSMRHERNLFAEGLDKVGGAPAHEALEGARRALGSADTQGGALRKCVIDGKLVVSNTDCKDSNRTSTAIAIHDSHGIEAPKQPVPAKAEPTSNPALDKMIEKQLH
jgi:hypothetical protein